MGINQGVIRFTKGYERYLTNSEKNRGYLFISKDKKIKDNDNLKIFINKELVKNRHIDSYGRVKAGRKLINDAQNGIVAYILENNNLTITLL